MLETDLAWNGLMAKTGERQSRALCEDRRQANCLPDWWWWWRHRRLIADFAVFLCLFLKYQKSEVIFAHQNLISNWLTNLVHAKSTGELISCGFSDRSVRSLVSANHSAKTTTFWLIFGLSPNLGLSETLNERLIQKVNLGPGYMTLVR